MTAETTDILIGTDGPIMTICLNRPAQRNAITVEMHHILQAAFDDFAARDDLRVAILSAKGPVFCAGSDLKAAAARRARGEPPLSLPRSGYGGLAQRFDLHKPIIAAVAGAAVGGGFELALACDLIVASDQAYFSLPEPRSGMVAIGGGPHRLARAIGMKRAMDIVLTSRAVDAKEGLALGFVNRVVPLDQVEGCCRALAQEMMRGAPHALAASKDMLNRTLDQPSLAAAMGDQNHVPAMETWRASGEGVEGARAFSEKRPPRWAQP